MSAFTLDTVSLLPRTEAVRPLGTGGTVVKRLTVQNLVPRVFTVRMRSVLQPKRPLC